MTCRFAIERWPVKSSSVLYQPAGVELIAENGAVQV
jgi:hypothetical protein